MEAAETSREIIAVYLHGVVKRNDLWYRVELPTMKKEDGGRVFGRRKRLHPRDREEASLVASLSRATHGYDGSWAVIGDDIYWTGGLSSVRGRLFLCEDLLKHNMTLCDPTVWEIESSSMIPRRIPFLATVDSPKQQLCVVAGSDCFRDANDDYYDDDENGGWSKCGEIYDLNSKTWSYLNAEYKLFSSYDTYTQATLARKDGGTHVVFYSLYAGSTLFLDLKSGTAVGPVLHDHFNVCQHSLKGTPPKGIQDADDLAKLQIVTSHVPAVFTNNTFYWFTFGSCCLYGYHIEAKRWLRSQSLREHFPSVHFDPKYLQYPVLVGLGNEMFLVIVAGNAPGEFTMASLTVATHEDSLLVSVGPVLPLSFDDPYFVPFEGKAAL